MQIPLESILPAVLQLLELTWYLIPFLILLSLAKSPSFKGAVGEILVKASAIMFLDRKTYHVLDNVTLPTEDGTTQIDTIIISKFGVFVVEVKNMQGWIFGSPRQANWTQQIYKRSYKFQNPLYQNYKHIKTLQSLLQIEEGCFHSLVVFAGQSSFKTSMPDNVILGIQYLRYIKSKDIPMIEETQIEALINIIETTKLPNTRRVNKEHIKHVELIKRRK